MWCNSRENEIFNCATYSLEVEINLHNKKTIDV